MIKRSQHILWLSGIAASLIICCQLYWVYQNYRTSTTNFTATANYALQQSIDRYQLSQNKLPTSLQYRKPSLTFMVRTLPSQDSLALDTPASKRRFSAEFSTVAIDEMHLPELRALVARLLSQQHHRQLHLDTLGAIFQQELQRNHIHETFKLSVIRGAAPQEGEISTRINFYKDPVLVKADLLHPVRFFLQQNFGPAAISTLLILVSAGSLFYMGRIIRRQEKLDSMKADFINNISHELKTPLSILKTSNEALADFGAADDPESLQRYLAINTNVITTLDRNVDRLLDLGRNTPQPPQWETADLQKIVKQVQVKLGTDSLASVRSEIPEDPFEVVTDPYMLDIILTNLLDNALKYAGDQPQICIRSSRLGNQWQLQVTDNGPGIAAAYLPYVFDRFYRVPTGNRHEVKGYGIGLAHVKDLASALNGIVMVKSGPGAGTSFTLQFKNLWNV